VRDIVCSDGVLSEPRVRSRAGPAAMWHFKAGSDGLMTDMTTRANATGRAGA